MASLFFGFKQNNFLSFCEKNFQVAKRQDNGTNNGQVKQPVGEDHNETSNGSIMEAESQTVISGKQVKRIRIVEYENESQMGDIMQLITNVLSEPYSIYTYRYFIHNWPKLCLLVSQCL